MLMPVEIMNHEDRIFIDGNLKMVKQKDCLKETNDALQILTDLQKNGYLVVSGKYFCTTDLV